jgi:uncharacterized membrane protein HdeD (DUF308 family)
MNDIKSSENSKVMGILSLVFGIIAIAISWLPMGRFIVIVLGIAAIVLGGMEIGRVNKNLSEKSIKNMAITGIVLGSVAIVVSTILPIVWGLFASPWFEGGHMGLGSQMGQGSGKLPELGRWKNLK